MLYLQNLGNAGHENKAETRAIPIDILLENFYTYQCGKVLYTCNYLQY